MRTQTFQVRKDSLHTTRIGTSIDQPLADRQVRVVVDRFALTSNNITYAAFGAAMNYWQFFPVAGDDADGRGCIPVWGFGRVVQSLHPGVAVGERLYGYWPMASHALLQPVKLTVGRCPPTAGTTKPWPWPRSASRWAAARSLATGRGMPASQWPEPP